MVGENVKIGELKASLIYSSSAEVNGFVFQDARTCLRIINSKLYDFRE